MKSIETCPICRSTKLDLTPICKCGYDFDQEKIVDAEKIRKHFLNIKSSKKWEEEIRLTARVHRAQQKKYGKTLIGVRGGWKQSDTGKLIGIKTSVVNVNLRLSEVIDDYPELLRCKKKTHAYM